MEKKPDIHENRMDLRSQLAAQTTYLLLIIAGIQLWVDLGEIDFPTERSALFISLFAACLLVLRLISRRPTLGYVLLTCSCGGLIAASMAVNPAAWIPFMIIPLALLAALLISHWQVLIVAGVGLTGILLVNSGIRIYPLSTFLFTAVASSIFAAMIERTLYTALEWAWTNQQQADQSLELARNRQGELTRTLKSLEISYEIQRKIQQQLNQARKQAEEARQMKELFAANISHELRTPLSLILGFSEIMYLSPEVYGENAWPPALRKDIYHIYRSSRHLMDMIDDILDLSRFDIAEFTLKKETSSIEDLMQNVTGIARDILRAKDVELMVEIEDNLPDLEIDRTRIRQVLLNLLNNAQRFTEQGTVHIGARKEKNEIVFYVSDTGAGIPEDQLKNIFNEFYQVDYSTRRAHEGTGLGLAICQRFVRAHKGRIWVESELGVGSTFYFSIPIPSELAGDLPPQVYRTVEYEGVEDGPTVLLVDPDTHIAALVQNHLNSVNLVYLTEKDNVVSAVQEHHPKAILYNTPPARLSYTSAPLYGSIPTIQYSIPSQAWLSEDFNVVNVLTKPIATPELMNAIDRLPDVHKILIVDDDRGFCHLMDRVIRTNGKDFDIRVAFDGQEGLDALRTFNPDLVLLDLIMPETDGFEVLNQIRSNPDFHTVSVIVLTATNYLGDALLQYGSGIILKRQEGMRNSEVLKCLESLIHALQPSYAATDPNKQQESPEPVV